MAGLPRKEWNWVRFECHAGPGFDVFVGGTFNRWKPSRFDKLRDRRHDGTRRTLLKLQTGRHTHDFLVNGSWLLDPLSFSHPNATVVDVA